MKENIENKHLKTENFDEASYEDENMNIGYSSDVSEHEKNQSIMKRIVQV